MRDGLNYVLAVATGFLLGALAQLHGWTPLVK